MWKRSRQPDSGFHPSPVCDVFLCLEQVLLFSSPRPSPQDKSSLPTCTPGLQPSLQLLFCSGLPVLFLNSRGLDTCLGRHSPCEWQASDLNTCPVISDLGWSPSARWLYGSHQSSLSTLPTWLAVFSPAASSVYRGVSLPWRFQS